MPNQLNLNLNLQVLKALSNPSHPDLASKLRFTAAAITERKQRDLRRWLEGGLTTHVLAILRSLPTLNLGPSEAAETCAACAAVLHNILQLLRPKDLGPGATPSRGPYPSLGNEASALEVLEAVVQFGMLPPAALEPLAPGRLIHIESNLELTPATAPKAPSERPFWTPLRICSYLLAAALSVDPEGCAGRFNSIAPRINPAVGQLVDARVFRHLLESALEVPGGEELPGCLACARLLNVCKQCRLFWYLLQAASHLHAAAGSISCLHQLTSNSGVVGLPEHPI
jgi:hypothetical protein